MPHQAGGHGNGHPLAQQLGDEGRPEHVSPPAIGGQAGGDWPQRAREAALALHVGIEDESTLSVGVLLLSHIRQAFDEDEADRLPTATLLERLASNEAGPWGRWWGAELNRDGAPRAAAADLARKLRGFERSDGRPIKPGGIRMPDGTTPRGYHREDFEPAWATYLGFGSPLATDATHATPLASPVASVASVATPHPNGEDKGSDGCPECGSLWVFGHGEDCSRRMGFRGSPMDDHGEPVGVPINQCPGRLWR
jgi:hypothetical protein